MDRRNSAERNGGMTCDVPPRRRIRRPEVNPRGLEVLREDAALTVGTIKVCLPQKQGGEDMREKKSGVGCPCVVIKKRVCEVIAGAMCDD